MRGTKWLIGVLGVGLSVFSCGGEEFGGGGSNEPDAGESTMADAGESPTAGGTTGTPAEGGRPGSEPSGGTGNDAAGMPSVQGGTGNGGGGGPDVSDCSDVVAPELPGDCQKLVCSMGMLTNQPDSNDAPEPRGACDVPKCDGAEPKFESDPSKCQVNETCSEGQCACTGCPNGKVPALSADLCRLPAGVTVVANKTHTGSAASHVADGDGQVTWNSGALDGVLTVTPASPQAMTAVAVWLTGAADNGVTPDKKYILVNVSVDTGDGPPVSKSGNFSFAQGSTGPLRLELGLVTAKKLTFTFQSPSSWIAVNEVVFEVCPQ